jgi:short-subunit dehydrogenase
MNVIQETVPHLRARGGGTIVNVTSGVGFVAVPLLSLYVSSKHAVEGLSESLAYELESQAIRVKMVEPGAMRNTAFSASGGATSQQVPVPAGYRAYFDHALGTMVAYPFPDTREEDVAAAIIAAANDTTPRMRYPVGPDIDEYARLRWSTSEDAYRDGMSRLTGQTAWRERMATAS